MKTATLGILVLSLTACSGADKDAAEDCAGTHRNGTYLQSFRERSGGTCGAVSDQVIAFDSRNSGTLGDGCAFDADDTVSADQCKLTRSYTCPLDGAPGTVSIVAITTEHDGGAKVTGTFTSRIHDGDGALVCASTYDVSYVRQ
jgi:hypothetical protein